MAHFGSYPRPHKYIKWYVDGVYLSGQTQKSRFRPKFWPHPPTQNTHKIIVKPWNTKILKIIKTKMKKKDRISSCFNFRIKFSNFIFFSESKGKQSFQFLTKNPTYPRPTEFLHKITVKPETHPRYPWRKKKNVFPKKSLKEKKKSFFHLRINFSNS